jgi:hypothetical protein
VRERWSEHAGLSATLHRVRSSLEGGLPHGFGYRLLIEYEAATGPRTAGAVSLRDAMIRWTRGPLVLSGGQFKTPFSREYIASITVVETAERATVVDTLATKRDIGVMAELGSNAYGTIALGAFNGEGQNASVNRDSTVLLVARILSRVVPFTAIGSSVGRYGSDSTRYGVEATIEAGGVLLRSELIGQHRHDLHPDDYGWYAVAG